MKVLIFGDVHGLVGEADIPAIEVVADAVSRTDADIILQAGDLCARQTFAKPVHWIFGNNDPISLIRACQEGLLPASNLIHIKTAEVLTFTSEEECIRVSGLNGAYDPMNFEYARNELDDPGYFTRDEAEKCLALRDIDLFLVHGCPSGLGFGREPDHANPAIRDILDTIKPRYMLCGHGHFYQKAIYGGSTVISLDEVRRAYYTLDTASGAFRTIKTDPQTIPEDRGLRYRLKHFRHNG